MKANKAPEKIYLEWYRIGDKKYREWVITPKTNNEPIQYTRTDAFIEKAYEFFDEHLWEYINVKANCDTFINIDVDKFKDDFKNYIKKDK